MRQRTVVVSVYDYPYSDTTAVATDSTAVVPKKVAYELKKQENQKNFWKGATVVLVFIIILEILAR